MSTPRRPAPRSRAAPMTASFRSCTGEKAIRFGSSGRAKEGLDGEADLPTPASELRSLRAVDRAIELRRQPLAVKRLRLDHLERDVDVGRRVRAFARNPEEPGVTPVVLLAFLPENAVHDFLRDVAPDDVAGAVPALGLHVPAGAQCFVLAVSTLTGDPPRDSEVALHASPCQGRRLDRHLIGDRIGGLVHADRPD